MTVPTVVLRAAGAATAALGMLGLSPLPAAHPPAAGEYSAFSVTGSSGTFGGSATSAAAGFPVGMTYGSSKDKSYLSVSTAPGNTTSTTTITFGAATPPADWAFALGDVDADQVRITGIAADGSPLAPSDLGFQGTSSYCAPPPRPGACAGPGPVPDVPSWDPAHGADGQPGVAPVAGDGGFTLPAVADGGYELRIDVPPSVPVTVDPAAGGVVVPPGAFGARLHRRGRSDAGGRPAG